MQCASVGIDEGVWILFTHPKCSHIVGGVDSLSDNGPMTNLLFGLFISFFGLFLRIFNNTMLVSRLESMEPYV